MSLFVKLCGIKTESDLDAAIAAEADAVGFVLTPSPRQISLAQAAHLKRLLPDHVLGVAVFHQPSPELLRRTEEEVAPDLFQAEAINLVGLAPEKQLPVVVDGEDMARRLDEAASATTRAWVLVDSSARGGTGRPPSWARLAQLTTTAKMILAGGLNEGNVTEVMSSVRPFGVDVSSGIESSPGVKDPERMRSFVAAARSALPLAGGH